MEKGLINGQILKFMKVNGNMEYLKDMARKYQRAQNMREIGKMVFQMDMENVFLKTEVAMTEIGKMDSQMVKVLKLIQMAHYTKVIGFQEKLKDLEAKLLKMEQFLLEIGKKVNLLKENALSQLEIIILEHGKMVNPKVKVKKYGLTVENIKAHFFQENLSEKELKQNQMEP